MQISVKGDTMRNVKTRKRLTFGLFAALVVGTVGAIVGSSKGLVEARAASTSGEDWVKITALNQIVSGDTYVIMGESNSKNIMGSSRAGSYQDRVILSTAGSTTLTGNTIDDTEVGWVITSTGVSNQYKINSVKDGDSGYLYYTGSKNEIAYGAAQTDDSDKWTFSYTDGLFVLTNVKTSTRILQYNSNTGQERFAAYTSNQKKLSLYKYVSAPTSELTSIAVTTPPTKTNYYVGDSFDPAGMVVTAYYDDDLSTSNVTNNVQITPTTLQLTDEFVTITYLTKSTTQPITVSERTFYTATLQYTGSTGNMTTGNNASSVGLNPTIFNVVSTERYPNPIHVGLNKDGQVRLYSGTPGNILTVSLQSAYSSYTIKSIKFSFGSSVTTAKIKADTDVIHDGSLTGNSDLSFGHIYSNQFSIENTGSSQIHILSIEINYLTSEQAALDFANEVMTGIGNNAESNCEVAYATLESIYGSLNTVSKALFDNSTEEIYSDARARMAYLQAWTAANTQSGDSTAGNVISDTREKSLSAALIIGLFGLTSLAGYYFLQKRKVI